MALKIFDRLFKRNRRGHIVLTPEEAYAPISETEEEAPSEPARIEETAAAKPVESEEAPAASEEVSEASSETAVQPSDAASEVTEEAPQVEQSEAEVVPEAEPLVAWMYAYLDDPSTARTMLRPHLIARFRTLSEDVTGFSAQMQSGARVTARVHTDPVYMREQVGYLKTHFKEAYLTDRDVQNAAMMQMELFNTQIEFSLQSPYTPEDGEAFSAALYEAAQPMRAFILNAETELYRWDKRLVISLDGRTDFAVFMPIRASRSGETESAEADMMRIKRSNELIKKHGVTAECLKDVQARESEAKLRSPEEIINRLAAIFACALKAQAYTSPREVASPSAWTLNAVKRLDGQYGVNRLFSGKEADYIVRSSDTRHEAFLLRFESCAVMLWALGLMNLNWPAERCDASNIMRVIRDADTEMLLRIAKPRTLSEVLNMHDVTYRLHSLCVMQGDDKLGTKVDHDVVYERHYALNWLLAVDGISSWDLVVPKT